MQTAMRSVVGDGGEGVGGRQSEKRIYMYMSTGLLQDILLDIYSRNLR